MNSIRKYAAAGIKSPVTAYGAMLLLGKVLFTALSAQFDQDPATVADWNYVVETVIECVMFFMARDAAVSSKSTGVDE